MHATRLEELDDLELVSRYKQTDDKNCVAILFQRYTHLIFGTCMKYLRDEDDAQDAALQIFEKLLSELHRHDIQVFKGWLHMVCKNFCLMHLRSASSQLKRAKEMQKDLIAFMEKEEVMHLSSQDMKELQLTRMEECLENLNQEQKLCVELFYLKEKSYQEVADITSFSMNNVKSYIQNGKRNLKICIEKKS
jgi:RNA polymerase sigma-70 factor (ECF subfamily)